MTSNAQINLLKCQHLKDHIKNFSDLAFDIVDDDGSGYLDANEIASMMKDVAIGMGVDAPTKDDVSSILASLDDDSDGRVDK